MATTSLPSGLIICVTTESTSKALGGTERRVERGGWGREVDRLSVLCALSYPEGAEGCGVREGVSSG